jgi:ElaB/YqjD/DUF883 family membrane-anchored ribosome-binding protein
MEKTETFVAEALRRVHVRLLDRLQELDDAASASSREAMEELRTRLEATLEHIAEHFLFEERNGYMDAVREREPRLERTIQHLADEHGHLTRGLDSLIAEAGAAPTLDEAFRAKVRAWIRQVRQHEARENEVVQDAFGSDIAAED